MRALEGGTGTGFVLSGTGDQVLAFQGLQTSPTFIAAIHMNQEIQSGTFNASTLTGWDDVGGASWVYNANRSAIPPGLTNGINAVMVVTGTAPSAYVEYDAAEYNCTGSNTSSSATNLLVALNDRNNWNKQNGPAFTLPSGCSFAVTAPPAITGQPSNASLCAGGTATFSVTATGATSYQWQENNGLGFTNITNGGVYSGAATASLTLTGVTAGMNGYSYKVNVIGSSTVTSNSATLTVTSPGTWLGGSAAWSNTANWSCGILPTSSTNVTIPSGTTFSPQVDITTAAANNITIASGATLTVAASQALTISGTLTNTGTYTANASGAKTIFAGGAQTIPALTYGALQMNGAGSKTLAGAVTVNGTLTLSNGYILLGANNLTIASTGNIAGSNLFSFAVINGTGGVIQNNIGAGGRTGTIVFPIGISTSSYTPIYLNNASGTADNFKARVINHVYSSYDASDNPTSSALTTKVVDRTWLMTEGTAGGSNATVTAQWNFVDEIGGFDNSNCVLSHYYSGAWHNGAAPNIAGGFDPYTIAVGGVTSFSPFGVGSVGGPLPLHLLSFSGKRAGKDVVLDWATADEKNIQGFVMERSTDAATFAPLGTTAARNSAAQTNTYRYTDATAGDAAKLYYRLKMLELDGSFSYSNVITVAGDAAATRYSIYPNPAPGDEIFIRTTGAAAGDLHITVRDMTGKKLYQTTVAAASTGLVPVNVKALPAGVYMVQISDNNTSEQIRMVRQ